MAWEIGRSERRRTSRPGFEPSWPGSRRRRSADGYLNTEFGRPGQRPRWSDLEWGHELYCFGHLFQAAVARARTRPDADDGLLDVARRAADLVCDVFGRRRLESRVRPPCSRGRARRARPGDGGAALPGAGPRCSSSGAGTASCATSSGGAPTTRTTCRSGRPRSCAATPCGPATWRPAPWTLRWNEATTSCWPPLHCNGRTRSPGGRTSPAVRARTTRTRRSGTTGRCRRTGRTPRPARLSPR